MVGHRQIFFEVFFVTRADFSVSVVILLQYHKIKKNIFNKTFQIVNFGQLKEASQNNNFIDFYVLLV